MIEDHRCGLGNMCRAREADGKPAGLATPRGLCDSCNAWIGRTIDVLPRDWLKLKVTIGEHRAPLREGARRPRPGPKVPLNVNSDALMRSIAEALDSCADILADDLNASRRPLPARRQLDSRRQYRRLTLARAFIKPHISRLSTLEGGLDALLRCLALARSVTRQLGETAQREKLHMPCPSCHAKALVKEVQDRRGREWHDGSETPEAVRCTNCAGEWTEVEYKWLTTYVLDDRKVTEMAEWLIAEARWQRDVALWLLAELNYAVQPVSTG